jgi:hypothetical protein
MRGIFNSQKHKKKFPAFAIRETPAEKMKNSINSSLRVLIFSFNLKLLSESEAFGCACEELSEKFEKSEQDETFGSFGFNSFGCFVQFEFM